MRGAVEAGARYPLARWADCRTVADGAADRGPGLTHVAAPIAKPHAYPDRVAHAAADAHPNRITNANANA